VSSGDRRESVHGWSRQRALPVSCDTDLRRWKSEMALVALFCIGGDRDELPHPPPSVTRASTPPEALARQSKDRRRQAAGNRGGAVKEEADYGD
jgi:hypothetical protein